MSLEPEHWLNGLRQQGGGFDPLQVLDALWLARFRLGRVVDKPSSEPEAPLPDAEEAPDETPSPEPGQTRGPSNDPAGDRSSRTTVSVPASDGQSLSSQRVRLPGARALDNPSNLLRALRLARRYAASRVRRVIDLPATIQATAEARTPTLIMSPALERALSVLLLCDDSPSMTLWEDLIPEVVQACQQSGAFRQVAVRRLRATSTGLEVTVRGAGGQWKPSALKVQPGTLAVVISDCVHRSWRDGRMARALNGLGREAQVSIWQMFTPMRWRRTALGPLKSLVLRAASPGTPNHQLRVEASEEGARGFPLPVFHFDEDQQLRRWARFAAHRGRVAAAGYVLPLAPTPAEPARATVTAASPAEQVAAFHRSALPAARDLASLFSAVPLTLRLMRLVQQACLPESTRQDLADVVLSGLLVPSGGNEARPGEKLYAFRPGVAEVLRQRLSGTAAFRVIEAVGQYLAEQHPSGVTWEGWVPTSVVGAEKGGLVREFAMIAAETLAPFRRFERAAACLAHTAEGKVVSAHGDSPVIPGRTPGVSPRGATRPEGPTGPPLTSTPELVARLWNLCHIFRDDGVTYDECVTELTYLFFLKMASETETEAGIPAGWRWADLAAREGIEQLTFYRELLIHLGAEASGRIQAIYANAKTALHQPRSLARLVSGIDALDWISARQEGLGDLYEGLLEKEAAETKSGAGQYFTPRSLIEAMVDLTKPRAGEVISDPAAGTLGFITRADAYIKARTDRLFDLTEAQQIFQRRKAYYAIELVPNTRRLALMSALLHDIDCEILLGDTLSPTGAAAPKSDVILTNPPFGTKRGGGGPTRDDFTFPTSNRQLAFLQHIYRNLKPGGRAAVVLPDNVLFEDGVGARIRADLMDKCNLHTILRLPTGIFYAPGVKTNVLFFTRKREARVPPVGGRTEGAKLDKDTGNTDAVWIYDLRTNMPSFGKRTPFTRAHLQPFVEAYGADPMGGSPRVDEGEEGRFRRFARETIKAQGDNLDVTWLREENSNGPKGSPKRPAISAPPARYDFFIACAPADKPAARDLRQSLKQRGHTVFVDVEDAPPGALWDQVIPEAQRHSRVTLVIVSPRSGAGFYDREEIASAIHLDRGQDHVVVPVVLDAMAVPGAMPYGLRRRVALFPERDGWPLVVDRLCALVGDFASPASVRAQLLEFDKALAKQPSNVEALRAVRKALRQRMAASDSLKPGRIFAGRYELDSLLGQGGFGQVWRAFDIANRRFVALKILHRDLDQRNHARFNTGIRTQARLDHPNIVHVLSGPHDHEGRVFAAFELMEGGDLIQAMAEGRIGIDAIPGIVTAIASALASAHSQGAVHCDVNPSNLLLDVHGKVHLTDFDLVRVDDSIGTLGVGTVLYTAPEALDEGQEVTPAADQYGLAMTTVCLLSGRPLPARTIYNRQAAVGALGLTEEVQTILLRGIDNEPLARWSDIMSFAVALVGALTSTKTSPPAAKKSALFGAGPTERILFLGACPIGTRHLRIDHEAELIRRQFASTSEAGRCEVHFRFSVSFRDMQSALHDTLPSHVHVSCHGDGGDLILADASNIQQRIPGSAVARLLGSFDGLEGCLLMFNDSASVALRISKANERLFCIGLGGAVSDRCIHLFSESFYSGLQRGLDKNQCFQVGVIAVEGSGTGEEGQFVFFGSDSDAKHNSTKPQR